MTSELSLAEVLVLPLELMSGNAKAGTRSTPTDLVADYTEVIGPERGLVVTPISRNVLVAAARVRAEDKRIKLPDAIHVATAIEGQCTHFVTGDRDLLRRVARFEMIDLTPSSLKPLVTAAKAMR